MSAGVLLLGFAENQLSVLFGWIGFVIFAGGLFSCAWGSSVPRLAPAERRERFDLLFGIAPWGK